jgi:hypothetical protein
VAVAALGGGGEARDTDGSGSGEAHGRCRGRHGGWISEDGDRRLLTMRTTHISRDDGGGGEGGEAGRR